MFLAIKGRATSKIRFRLICSLDCMAIVIPIETEDAAVRRLEPLLRQASPIQNPKWYHLA
jgi:hypothetical protein